MGCASSKEQAAVTDPETSSANDASRAIDNELKADYEKQKNTIKILFLGTGESGKSVSLDIGSCSLSACLSVVLVAHGPLAFYRLS